VVATAPHHHALPSPHYRTFFFSAPLPAGRLSPIQITFFLDLSCKGAYAARTPLFFPRFFFFFLALISCHTTHGLDFLNAFLGLLLSSFAIGGLLRIDTLLQAIWMYTMKDVRDCETT
jgi:hypothetical protein